MKMVNAAKNLLLKELAMLEAEGVFPAALQLRDYQSSKGGQQTSH